jgi:hypothetical protein
VSQSSFIAAALIAAFVLWLARNNRLGAYTAVLWGATAQPTPTGSASSSPSASGVTASQLGSVALDALAVA